MVFWRWGGKGRVTEGEHPGEKAASFGHFPNGGGKGSNPNPKVLSYVKKGCKGFNPFQSCWGSVVLDLHTQNLLFTHESYLSGVQNRWGGQGNFWKMSKRKQIFFWMFSLTDLINQSVSDKGVRRTGVRRTINRPTNRPQTPWLWSFTQWTVRKLVAVRTYKLKIYSKHCYS